MAVVRWPDTLYSLKAQNKFGDCKKTPITKETYPARKAQFPMAGIYQTRHSKKGQYTVQEVIYRPTNPQTEAQQAWRLIFKNGVDAWHALDNEEREIYNLRAYPLHLEGFNLFMRKWLNSHKN